jgi:hypothetical protein
MGKIYRQIWVVLGYVWKGAASLGLGRLLRLRLGDRSLGLGFMGKKGIKGQR